ncbi:MAG: ATP-binding cassette domain-containing protein [Spirochaetaceae bacterium]|jgi:ABC-type nitrate/sulfonate/bicarbonate transport system ATPase subunit/ABC-type nitrate/sulfonate/bicarbonate transport system permease component|nr:ATP-binding cassette domain-containing protein [Spirochaetaceae bacterium]
MGARETPGKTRLVWSGAGVAALLLLWELGARLAGSDLLFPGPLPVIRRFIRVSQSPAFFPALFHSFARVVLGIGAAVPLGVALGIVSGLHKTARAFFQPFLTVIAAVPVMSVILIAFLALGAERTPAFTAFLMVFPVATASALEGVASIDRGLREVFRVFSLPRTDRIAYLYIPGIMPFILAALRSGLSLCWKVVAAAEVLVQPVRGLGTDMQRAKAHLETPELFAWTLAVVLAAALSQAPLALLRRLSHRYFRLLGKRGRSEKKKPRENRDAPSEKGAPRIEMTDISFGFGDAGDNTEKPLFEAFSLRLGEENPTVILGPSGCGKTTLLRLMAGLITPQGGVATAGKPGEVSFVFQEPRLLPWLTVRENALLPVKRILRTEEAEARAARFLDLVSLTDKAGAYPASLSGGQKQRAALARAFIYPAAITFMDEPFQSLDISLRTELMEMTLGLLKAEPRLLVAVTHEPREALFLGRRIIVLGPAPGGIVLDEPGCVYGSPEATALEARLRPPRLRRFQTGPPVAW